MCSGVSWLGPRERILHSNSFIGSHPSSPRPITSFTYECSYSEQKIQDCNLDNYSSLADRNDSINAANAGRSVNGSHSEHLKNLLGMTLLPLFPRFELANCLRQADAQRLTNSRIGTICTYLPYWRSVELPGESVPAGAPKYHRETISVPRIIIRCAGWNTICQYRWATVKAPMAEAICLLRSPTASLIEATDVSIDLSLAGRVK